MGALESHGMEEEWRLLSFRARIACSICQIYIILRERNDWEEGGEGISQIMTWKIMSRSGKEEEEQGSNVEKSVSVRLRACTMTRLHHPEEAPLGVWWACDKLSIRGWTVEGREWGGSGTCGDKVSPRRWRRRRCWRLRRRQKASSSKHRPRKYNNAADEEHLKVMTGRSATCRGAAEERNWIIYHCSFSRVECWLANGPWGRKKTTINAPEDQSQQERGASYQSFPVAPRVFSPLATIMKRDACEPEGGTKHWKKVLGARVSDLVACNGTKC